MKWDELRRQRFTDEEIRKLDAEAVAEFLRDDDLQVPEALQALMTPGEYVLEIQKPNRAVSAYPDSGGAAFYVYALIDGRWVDLEVDETLNIMPLFVLKRPGLQRLSVLIALGLLGK